MIRRFVLMAVLSVGVCGCDRITHPKPVTHLFPSTVGEPPCKKPEYHHDRYFQGFHYPAGDYCRFPLEYRPYNP